MVKFNIKKLRMLNDNITQTELSQKTNIRLDTLSQYERNVAKTISIKNLDALCENLNCDAGDIFTFVPDVETETNEYENDIIKELIARIDYLEAKLSEHIANHK